MAHKNLEGELSDSCFFGKGSLLKGSEKSKRKTISFRLKSCLPSFHCVAIADLDEVY